MPDHLKGLLITTLGVLMLVPDSLFVRLIEAPALTTAFWRALLAAVALGLGVLVVQGPGAYRALLKLGPGLWLYIANMAASGILFVVAVSLTSVANVVFIIAAMPAFAALMSWLFLGERLTRRTAITIAVVIAGIGIIAWGSGEVEHATRLGDFVALVVALNFAVALTTARRLRTASLVPALPLGLLLAAALLFPFTDIRDVTPSSYGYVAIYGPVFIASAMSLITLGPRYLPSAEVALLILLESVLAPILAWLVVGEAVGVWTLVGGALVLGALAVSNALALMRRPGRAARAGRPGP